MKLEEKNRQKLDQLVHAGDRVGEHVGVETGGLWGEEKVEWGGWRTRPLLINRLTLR